MSFSRLWDWTTSDSTIPAGSSSETAVSYLLNCWLQHSKSWFGFLWENWFLDLCSTFRSDLSADFVSSLAFRCSLVSFISWIYRKPTKAFVSGNPDIYSIFFLGILLELGLEKQHLTKQKVEQYVLKLDAEAQIKFKVFLQNSMQNPHTLFVLIHDHAHWDLMRWGYLNLLFEKLFLFSLTLKIRFMICLPSSVHIFADCLPMHWVNMFYLSAFILILHKILCYTGTLQFKYSLLTHLLSATAIIFLPRCHLLKRKLPVKKHKIHYPLGYCQCPLGCRICKTLHRLDK